MLRASLVLGFNSVQHRIPISSAAPANASDASCTPATTVVGFNNVLARLVISQLVKASRQSLVAPSPHIDKQMRLSEPVRHDLDF